MTLIWQHEGHMDCDNAVPNSVPRMSIVALSLNQGKCGKKELVNRGREKERLSLNIV